jgi:ubiquinone/menaquinone biosynthesis C-methylase UbiE
MYVCPQCKGELSDFFCARCATRYPLTDGIPCFMLAETATSDRLIREIYDDIYLHHTDVWLDQGRSDRFQDFFGALVRDGAHQRLLEVGCGEGALLAALPAAGKFGIDPSAQALKRARTRSDAECAVARCEQLPFPAGAFDVVVAVGVMEHFELLDASIAEIHRVLAPGGRYLTLIQTDMTRAERLALKIRQYVFPQFRPVELLRWFGKWLKKKTRHPIVQPLRKSYTADSARQSLQRNGLQVVRTISEDTEPAAPLGGPHVIILVARKSSA